MQIQVSRADRSNLSALIKLYYPGKQIIIDKKVQDFFDEILSQTNYYVLIAKLNHEVVGSVSLSIVQGFGDEFPHVGTLGLKISDQKNYDQIKQILLNECEIIKENFK